MSKQSIPLWVWPAAAAALAAIALLPRLGSYGFWEPDEIQIAERVLERESAPAQAPEADPAADEAGDQADEVEPQKKPGKAAARARSRPQQPPPFTERVIGGAIDTDDPTELAARLPLALFGWLAVMAAFYLGYRIRDLRTGFVASVVMLSLPLLVFQSRQLTSDIGAACGIALCIAGLFGLAWPRDDDPPWMAAIDGLLALAGAILAFQAARAVLGLVVPFGAVALAGGASLLSQHLGSREEAPGAEAIRARWRLAIATVGCLVVALVALGYFCFDVFSLVDAEDGELSIFGKALRPTEEYAEAIGGVWLPEGNPKVTFNSLFEQLAFGLFPWIALAPFAVARLASGRGTSERERFAGYLLFAAAAGAWLVAALLQRKLGPTHFPGIAPVAVAVALFFASAERERAEADPSATPVWRLLALFVFLAAVVVGKDIHGFPERFLGLHLEDAPSDFPEGVSLHKWTMVLGVLTMAATAAWLAAGHKLLQPIARYGLHATVGLAVIFALFVSQVWIPQLSKKLSSRNVFAVYRDLREPGDRLGIMGKAGAGPRFYSGGEFQQLKARRDLLEFLGDEGRAFALVRGRDLCAIHKDAGKEGREYYVLDDSNSEFLLLSNQLKKGESDRNPLARAVLRERPTSMGRQLDINFDDRLTLIGADIPASVERGDSFEMTLYYQVNKSIGRNWKIFVHFDGAGMRFQGDHDPLEGRCGTAYWQPGDFIVDRFKVDAGGMSYPRTTYQIWTGLFVGSAGNWTNMTVKSGNPDDNNRVNVGSIRVK